FAFSAAKSFTQANELRNAVYDSKGNIVPENTFRRAVAKISTKYNKQYLQAERHQVMAAGTQGSRWIDIQESKDTHPFLEYVTARDERVREEHLALDGIILPIDDPFWERYYPPNGWRCRCATRKLSDREAEHKSEAYKGKEKMEMPNSETAQKMAGKVVAKPFRHNVGTTEIFERDGHPYFKANKEAKEMQLSAVKNYGMKKVEEIYNHPSRLSPYKGELKSKEEYNDWWAAQEQKHGKEGEGFTLIDKKNKISAHFDTKLKTKLRDTKERWNYGDEMTEVFFKPNEVWACRVGSATRAFHSEFFNAYIKYYEDVPLVLLVNQSGRVDSFYKLSKISQVEQFRIGLLKQKR
ncbi:MAG: phage minor head protein, partial [Bacteroidales bacterium]